jgi:hypothetical protein
MLGISPWSSFAGLLLLVGCGRATAADAAESGHGRTPVGGSAPTGGSPQSTAGGSHDGGGGGSSKAGSAEKPQTGGVGGTPDEAAGGAAGAGDSATLDVQTILNSYRNWAPQTAEPVNVSGYIFGLCRLPTLPEQAFAESEHGDGRYLQDWANPAAVEGIAARGAPAFAAGSVIVKEKYAELPDSEADLVAIGLMIKREPGFNPARGDWDYAYFEPELGVVQTEEQSVYCAGCHSGASATDHVYVDGLKP